MIVGASDAPFKAAISPITSGCFAVGSTSAEPPMRRTYAATHSAAAATSPRWAASALTLGMRMNSASSSNQACSTRADLSAQLLPERQQCGQSEQTANDPERRHEVLTTDPRKELRRTRTLRQGGSAALP